MKRNAIFNENQNIWLTLTIIEQTLEVHTYHFLLYHFFH